jgi:hypothetical protein
MSTDGGIERVRMIKDVVEVATLESRRKTRRSAN